MSETKGRMAFYVNEYMHTPHGYVPAIVFENDPGYYPMMGKGEFSQPWYWGHDIAKAKQIAVEANAKLGLTETEADQIVFSSMAASLREDSKREAAAERWDRIKRGLPADVVAGFWNRKD